MAGASLRIDVKYNDREIVKALKRLERAGGDMHQAMSEIGDGLLRSHKQRFADQVDPDGNPWEENTAFTKSRKKKDSILLESGDLMDSLHPEVSSDGLEFGSNLEYAAMHQFGGTTAAGSMIPGKPIPARPFLGISSDDEREIIAIIEDHIRTSLK